MGADTRCSPALFVFVIKFECACENIFEFALLIGDNLSRICAESLSPLCWYVQCIQPIVDTYVSF